MNWITSEPVQMQRESDYFKSGEVMITVGYPRNGKIYKGIHISFGEFSDETHEECLKSWPQRALELLREQVAILEEKIVRCQSSTPQSTN